MKPIKIDNPIALFVLTSDALIEKAQF